jgi:uncharacterized protein YegL
MSENPVEFRHYCLILDCSGSMTQFMPLLRSSANEMIDALRNDPGVLSILLFNTETAFLCYRVPLKDAPILNEHNVFSDGYTALYDAIQLVLQRIHQEFEATSGEFNTDVTITIFTDGLDNSSKSANLLQTRLAIGQARERGWNILFIGANVPGLAADLGIESEQAIDVKPSDLRSGFKRTTTTMRTTTRRFKNPTDKPDPKPE